MASISLIAKVLIGYCGILHVGSIVLNGATIREFGFSVVNPVTLDSQLYTNDLRNIGDVNGDGFDDLSVGVAVNETVYIIYGESSTVVDIDVSKLYLSSADSSIIGEGFKVVGASDWDMTGFSVSSAGDFNNDGYDDLLVGAYNASSGAVYVIFGSSSLSEVFLNDTAYLTSSSVLVIYGEASGDQLGYSLSGGYDVNGDGYDDIIVGAPGHADGVGIVYVVYGGSSSANINMSISGLSSSQGFVITGDSSQTGFGFSVAMLSDFDGDGFADLIIGSPNYQTTRGSVSIVYGNTTNAALSISDVVSSSRGYTIEGESYSQTGYCVAKGGDVNGDGLSDVIIGMPYARRSYSASQVSAAGGAIVIFGSSTRKTNSWSVATNGVVIYGASLGDFAGYSVNSGGDVNGDGYDDLLLGAPFANDGVGVTYVVFGSKFLSTVHLSQLSSSSGFSISCSSSYNNHECGRTVDAVDFNGDGLSDVLVSASFSSESSTLSNDFLGYMVLGRLSGTADMSVASLFADGVTVIVGAHLGDQAGGSVSSAGDFNGDGYDDLIVGAPAANSLAGAAYVVLGSASAFYQNNKGLRPSDNVVTISGDASYLGSFVTSLGDVNSDGYGDVLVSASDSCFLIYGSDSTDSIETTSSSAVSFTGIASSCNAAGDFNNDSIADIVVIPSQNEKALVLLGSFTGTVNVSSSVVGNSFTISFPSSKYSSINQVFPAGDVNGDDFDDVIVMLGADVYVVYGNNSVLSVSINSLNGTRGFHLKPLSSVTEGTAASAGDINNDGYADIIVGYPGYDDGKGISYIIYGRASQSGTIHLDDIDASLGFAIEGVSDDGQSGGSVGSAGDINNDGYSDFMISSVGTVHVVYGRAALFASTDLSTIASDSTLGFAIQASSDKVTMFLSNSPGDLDGNGVDDIVLSDPSAFEGVGAAYVAYSVAAPTMHPTQTPTYSNVVAKVTAQHHLSPLQKFYVAVSIIATFSFLIAVPIFFARFICFRMLDDFGVDPETGYYVSNPAKKRGVFLGAVFKQCSVTYIDAYIEYKEKEARRKELDLDVSLTLQLKAMEDAAEQIDMLEKEKQKKAEMIILNDGDEEKGELEEKYPMLAGVSPEVMSIINKKRSPRAEGPLAIEPAAEEHKQEGAVDGEEAVDSSPSKASKSSGTGSTASHLKQLGMTSYTSDESMSGKQSKYSLSSVQSMDSTKSATRHESFSVSANQLLRDSVDLEESVTDSRFDLNTVLEPAGISTHSIISDDSDGKDEEGGSKTLKFKSPSVRFKHVESEDVYDYHDRTHSESIESMLPSAIETRSLPSGIAGAFSVDSVDDSRYHQTKTIKPSLSAQLGIPTIKMDLSASSHSIKSSQRSRLPPGSKQTDFSGLSARTASIDEQLLTAKSPNARSRYTDSGIISGARALTQQLRDKHDLHDIEEVMPPTPLKPVTVNHGSLTKKASKSYEDETLLSEIGARANAVSTLERKRSKQKSTAAKSPAPRTPGRGGGAGGGATTGNENCIVSLVHTIRYDFEDTLGRDNVAGLLKWLREPQQHDFMGLIEPVTSFSSSSTPSSSSASSAAGEMLLEGCMRAAWSLRQLIEHVPVFSSIGQAVSATVKSVSHRYPAVAPLLDSFSSFKMDWFHNKALLITLHLISGHIVASWTHRSHPTSWFLSTVSSIAFAARLYVRRIMNMIQDSFVEVSVMRCSVTSVIHALPSSISCASSLYFGLDSVSMCWDPVVMGGLGGLQCIVETRKSVTNVPATVANAILMLDLLIAVILMRKLVAHLRCRRDYNVQDLLEGLMSIVRAFSCVLFLDYLLRCLVVVVM